MTQPIALPSFLELDREQFDALFAAIEAAPAFDGTPAGADSGADATVVDLDADRTRRPLPVLEALAALRREGIVPADVRVAWIGAASPELHSWLEAAARLDFALTLAVPDGFEPDAALYLACEAEAPDRIVRVKDPARARQGADIVVGPEAPAPAIDERLRARVRAALAAFVRNARRPRVDFRALADLVPADPPAAPGVGLRAQMR
jgi:hypothetical protein